MYINLEKICGIPLGLNTETCELVIGKELNKPKYCVRMLHDLDAVWANSVPDDDRVIYRYTSGLWFPSDEAIWNKANIIYGIVVFPPGVFGGEYVKSSGQYHPIKSPNTKATPEVYTVLSGTGHFLLQKSSPPYKVIDDAVMVEVQAGETFIVPPDYGHLQINPGKEPLVFSYAVMDGMSGIYEPFKQTSGAIYYEMAKSGAEKFVYNSNYKNKVPLRFVKAGEICQLSFLNDNVTYQKIRDNIDQLDFITISERFPSQANL
jgi:glucose-6-phosphate isomerase, archaeal